MTVRKREFEAIAKSLRATRQDMEANWPGGMVRSGAVRQAAMDMLPVLKRLNPKFEEGKFMEVVDGKSKGD